MNEQIYIVGVGAIGKALAVFLNAQGKSATLIRGSVDNRPDEILPLTVNINDGTSITASVTVSTFSEHDTIDGIIVLTNKSFGNAAIAEALRGKVGRSPIIVMQNGLNVEQPFLDDKFENICRCVLLATSQQISDSTLRFKPVSASPIGVIQGDTSWLPTIVSTLYTKEFEFIAEPNIKPLIWKKVIANCVFNSICPLLEVDNGIFHRNETARLLAIGIISECVGIAREVGVDLDEKEVLQTVLQISKASDGQIISTLQDIRNKRPTEIESLNFAIVNTAAQAGKADSVSKTKILGELTKLKSEMNRHW
ncbi:MAG: 2-dehydropantoate 2-reductase [Chryseolinea sp.]